MDWPSFISGVGVAIVFWLLPLAFPSMPQSMIWGGIVFGALLAAWGLPFVHARVAMPQAFLMAAGAGLLVAGIGWTWSSPMVATASPTSTAESATKPLLLSDLFQTDFANTARYEVGSHITLPGMDPVDVRWKRYTDAGSKSTFMGLYIPRSAAAYDISAAMADGAYKEALDHMNNTLEINTKVLGDSAGTRSDEFTFSGRIYLYVEDSFSPQQVGTLTDLYQKQGLSLIIRGSDYVVSRNLLMDRNAPR